MIGVSFGKVNSENRAFANVVGVVVIIHFHSVVSFVRLHVKYVYNTSGFIRFQLYYFLLRFIIHSRSLGRFCLGNPVINSFITPHFYLTGVFCILHHLALYLIYKCEFVL
jgi:hypothetical protein